MGSNTRIITNHVHKCVPHLKLIYNMATIDKIITKLSCKCGAPMGRHNVGTRPTTITSGRNGRIAKRNQITVFDCKVPMSDGAYDKGGAYWGLGAELRVSYTKDLSYIEFYRKGMLDNPRK